MMKRVLAILFGAAILISALSGCVQTPSGTEQTEQTETETSSPATEESMVPEQTGTEAVTPAQLVISEVMPNNRNLVLGHEKDWIELHNREETAVSLDGWFLTDDPQKPEALPLAGLQIPADGHLVVELEESGVFKLAKEGETVYLTFQGEIVSQLEYTLAENGESFDLTGICQYPTPGFANTEEGYLAYLDALQLPELIISEVMSSNSQYLPVKGECYDWVEVQNNSGEKLNLKGYFLGDKRDMTQVYYFPEVSLEPGEYAVVYCSGEPSLGADHAPFKVSADGETVFLGKGDRWIDALVIPGDVQKDESYGRSGKVPSYQKTPTPSKANSEGFLSSLAAPTASVTSGVYEQPIAVTLSGEGTVYYTLDGSCPTVNSAVYTQPLEITGVTTIRTFSVSGEQRSAMSTYTYAVGAVHDLPVLSIAIPEDKLNGEKGLFTYIWEPYEYEATLTLIEDGEEKFSVPFGLRLHGHDSRKGEKISFQLRFRSEYGAEKLYYKLFENRDFAEFNSLLLKGGSEDYGRAMMRDELMTSIVDGNTELYVQAYKPVVLYLDGQYWGIYYLRERYSDDYVASHLNVSEESVDLLKYGGAAAHSGSNSDYLALRSYVSSHDMSLPENYAYLQERMNVTSLMDWYICRSYFGDIDLDNIRRFRSLEADGKWQWALFDLDWGMYRQTGHLFSQMAETNGADVALMQAILKSEAGRDAFLKRYAYLMSTVLNETYINGQIDTFLDQIQTEMPRDRERWGKTMSAWEKQVQLIRDCAEDEVRGKAILADLQKYFSLTDDQMAQYFGA